MKIKLTLLGIAFTMGLQAQFPEPQDSVYSENINPAAAIRHALQPLDKTDITTNLLLEAGLPLMRLENLTGSDTPTKARKIR